MAIIRSMSTKEADHGRATYQMRTGYLPGGPVQYPTLGSLFSKELEQPGAELPNFVSIAPYRFFSPAAYGPGFLGPQYAPLVVGENQQSLIPIPGQQQHQLRRRAEGAGPRPAHRRQRRPGRRPCSSCWARCRTTSSTSAPACPPQSHQQRLPAGRDPDALAAPPRRSTWTRSQSALRDRYGRNLFGQGCLLARRLVEHGVPFVEVTLATVGNLTLGWDTHINNFDSVKTLSGVLDPAWATLMDDLKDKGLLDTHPDRLDGRVRPDAEDQRQPAAATTGPTPGPPSWPAAASRAARSSARPAPTAWTVDRSARRRRRFPGHRRAWPWASTSRSRTTPTSAGPSASSSRPPSRSRRCSHEYSVMFPSEAWRSFCC